MAKAGRGARRARSGARALAAALLALGAAARAEEAPAAAEPTLGQAVEAAARRAAGSGADDELRAGRARRSRWLPVLRAQLGGRDDERLRAGEWRGAPISEEDALRSRSWLVSASWDLPQLLYGREEVAIAASSAHLARARQQAAAQAARLYAERLRALRTALAAPEGPADRLERALAVLTATAELDALTGGLFAAALARAQAEVDVHTRQLGLRKEAR